MDDMTSEQMLETRRKMQSYQWYHTIELGHGLVTPGPYDHRPLLHHHGLPGDLTGKTVLDIGPAQGFFAFEFEKRGAARVVAVELPRWSEHDGSASLKASFERDHVDVQNEDHLHGALEFAIKTLNSNRLASLDGQFDIRHGTIRAFVE